MFDVDGLGRGAGTGFPVASTTHFRGQRTGRSTMAVATRAVLLAPLLLGVSSFAATAQEMTPSIAAAACGACHGPDGKSTGSIPSLDKIDAVTMVAKLKGFRNGELEATIMNRIAKGFTDAEIDMLVKVMAAR
jgi:cytochrome c553